ncbi:MAG: RNA-binding protein [Kiritimatiellae bacterium]|nr:RNA-binding protein [Kiritimatiellia bacterium]
MTSIYIGNLAFGAREEDLRASFEKFGEVASVRIAANRITGRALGFAFLEMPDGDAARRATKQLHNTEVSGRPIRVSEARPSDRVIRI